MNTLLLLLTVLALAATAAVWHGLYLRPDGPLGLALRRLAVDDRGEAGTTEDTSDNHDDDGGDQGDAQGDDQADGDSGGEDALGDAGKKALDAMKSERNAARREARDLKRRIADLEARASAAGKFADPGDALRLLDLSEFEVDEDGTIDEEQIADAIDALLTAKPYLSAQGGKRFQGTGDGARKGSKPPSLEQRISEAESKGDWRTVITLQNQRLAEAAGHPS